MWTRSLHKKTIAVLLRSAQWFLTLRIAGVYQSTASQSACILANILPIDYKIKETASLRALSPHLCLLIPPSTSSVLSPLLQIIRYTPRTSTISHTAKSKPLFLWQSRRYGIKNGWGQTGAKTHTLSFLLSYKVAERRRVDGCIG